MRVLRTQLGLALWALSLAPQPAAHEGLHERIAALDRALAGAPKQPDLYLERGTLHHRHGDLSEAWADCEAARALDPSLPEVFRLTAELHATEGRERAARSAITRYLETHANDVSALALRARLRANSGDSGDLQSALADWARAIELGDPPQPDLFHARAFALDRANRTAEAIASLDEARVKLGRLPALELGATEYEVRLGRYDAALARLASLAQDDVAPAEWIARKAEILSSAKRHEAARSTWREVLRRLDQMPPKRRSTSAAKALRLRAERALAASTLPQ